MQAFAAAENAGHLIGLKATGRNSKVSNGLSAVIEQALQLWPLLAGERQAPTAEVFNIVLSGRGMRADSTRNRE